MSTSVPRVLSAALVASLGLGVLTACSGTSSSGAPAVPLRPARSAAPAAPDVVRGLDRALDRRASAVRTGDERAFDAGLAASRPAFVSAQHTYFANLAQLPLARFGYRLHPAEVVRDGDAYWAVVDVRLQLAGYDASPVTRPDRFLFVPVPHHPGRFVLASTTDARWERRNHVDPQPWDTGPIEVRTGPGVLGIFDAASVADAGPIVDSVVSGIAAVAGLVPYPWSRSVVVYALSDDAVLARVDDLPGADPASLDGVAFAVTASPAGGPVASTRIVLNPRMVGRDGPERDRLVRHELTHVAVGSHDDRAPVWLGEGLAEWVSVRPLAPQDRLVAPGAVAAAERGLVDLPANDAFNDADAGVHYATAWWACEYLAATFGAPVLWSLLDAMDAPGADPDRVLHDVVGLGSRALARKAGRLIVATFAAPAPSGAPVPDPR